MFSMCHLVSERAELWQKHQVPNVQTFYNVDQALGHRLWIAAETEIWHEAANLSGGERHVENR